MLLFKDYVKEVHADVTAMKAVSRKADYKKIEKFLTYIDYFNIKVGRKTKEILGTEVEKWMIDSRLAHLIGPRCVTFKTESYEMYDLMVRDESVVFDENNMNVEDWEKMQEHFLGYFKATAKNDKSLDDIMKKITIADVRDVYVVDSIMVPDRTNPSYPIELITDIWDKDEVDLKGEKAAVKGLFNYTVKGLRGNNS